MLFNEVKICQYKFLMEFELSNLSAIYCFKSLSWQIVNHCIRDLELSLTDTQPGAVWGVAGEMLSCPRLDNQVRDNRFCTPVLYYIVRATATPASGPSSTTPRPASLRQG